MYHHMTASRKHCPGVIIRGNDSYLFCEQKAIAPNEADDFEKVYQVSNTNGKERAKSTMFMVKFLNEDDNSCHNKFDLLRNTGTLFHLKEATDELPEALKRTPAIHLCTKDTSPDGQIYLAHLDVVMRNGISDKIFDQAVGLADTLNENDGISPAAVESGHAIANCHQPMIQSVSGHAIANCHQPKSPPTHAHETHETETVTDDDKATEEIVVDNNTNKAKKRKSLIDSVPMKKLKSTIDPLTREHAIGKLHEFFKRHFPMANEATKSATIVIFNSLNYLIPKIDTYISMMKGELKDCTDLGEDPERNKFWTLRTNLHRIYHGQTHRTTYEVMVSKCVDKTCFNTSHIFFLSGRNFANLENLLLVDGCLKAAGGLLKMDDVISKLLDQLNNFKGCSGLPSLVYASREARSQIENYYNVGNFDDCFVVDAMTLEGCHTLLIQLHCALAHQTNLPQSDRPPFARKLRVKYFKSCGNTLCISPKHVRCYDCGELSKLLTCNAYAQNEDCLKRRNLISRQLVAVASEEPSTDRRLVKFYELFKYIYDHSNIRTTTAEHKTIYLQLMRLARNTLNMLLESIDEAAVALFFDDDNTECLHNNKIAEILAVALTVANLGSLDSERPYQAMIYVYRYKRVQTCKSLHHCCNTNHLNFLGYKRVLISENAWKLLPLLLTDNDNEHNESQNRVDHDEEVPFVQKTPDEMVEEILLDETIPDILRSNIAVFKQCIEAAHKITETPRLPYVPDETLHRQSSELALIWLAKHKHLKGILHMIEKTDKDEKFNRVRSDLRDLFQLTQSLIVTSERVSATYLPDWRNFCGKDSLECDELRRRYLIEAEILIAAHAKNFCVSVGQKAKYPDICSHVTNRILCYLVASNTTLASFDAEDLVTDFTCFNARSPGAKRPHLRCLRIFQTIAVAGQSVSLNTIPHSEQSQLLAEASVLKYSEDLVKVLSALRILTGRSEKEWSQCIARVLKPLYKKHEMTHAPTVQYPILKPDLYRALDRIIEKDELSPCNISDITLFLLLVETGWRPSSVVKDDMLDDNKVLKLRQVRFSRNCNYKRVLEITPMFSKTENQYKRWNQGKMTEKKHKYCIVQWMILYLRLRNVLEKDTNGEYVIVDGHKDEPLFVNMPSGMFSTHPETTMSMYTAMADIALALKIPSNQVRGISFRKGYALQTAFDFCNARPYVTMNEVENCLKSTGNWKSRECLVYLNYGDHKFTTLLRQFLDARMEETDSIVKIEEFYVYAHQIGANNKFLFTSGHPIISLLKTHFFKSVSLEQVAAYLNIFINSMDSTLQWTRRRRNGKKDTEYERSVLNVDAIVRRYPFLTAPEMHSTRPTLSLHQRYCEGKIIAKRLSHMDMIAVINAGTRRFSSNGLPNRIPDT